MLSGERKKFGLRSARKPLLVDGLSNTVVVYENGIAYYCFIDFAQAFVDAVGAAMPRGVSTADMAFVHVMFDRDRVKWVVSGCYLSSWEQHTLWVSEEKPAWVKELKIIRQNHEHSDQASSARGNQTRSNTSADTGTRARVAAFA